MKSLLRFITDWQRDFEVHHSLAEFFVREGRLDDAERELRNSLDLDPSNCWSHLYIGVLLQNRDDLSGAESHFRRAAELRPDLSSPWTYMAMVFERQDRFEEADEYYEKGIRVDPDCPFARLRYEDWNRRCSPSEIDESH